MIYTVFTFVLSAIAFWVNSVFSASYPSGFLFLLLSYIKNGDIIYAIKLLCSHFIMGIKNYFNPVSQPNIFVFMRYILIIFIIVFLIETFFQFNVITMRYIKRKQVNRKALSFVLILSALILIVVTLYDVFDWRDFKVFTPVLLFVCLSSILEYRRFLIPIIISCIATLGFLFYVDSMKIFVQGRYTNHNEKISLIEKISYDPNAKSRWDNTIISNIVDVKADAGIGILFMFHEIPEDTDIYSKYLLTSKSINRLDYRLLAKDETNYLYIKNTK